MVCGRRPALPSGSPGGRRIQGNYHSRLGQDRREGLLIPMFGISERAEGVENSLMALADYWEEGNERGAYFAALPSSYYLGLLYYNFLFYNIEGIYGLSNVPYILE